MKRDRVFIYSPWRELENRSVDKMGTFMRDSIVSDIKVTEKKVEIFPGDIVKNIVRKELIIEYEGLDVDLRELDFSILTVPYILNVAPVIWAMGLKCRIYSTDEVFLESLEVIKNNLKKLYPALNWDGEIIPERVVKNLLPEARENYRDVLFFSGGFDSTYSALKSDPDKTVLLTVRGHDISLNDDSAWHSVVSRVEDFSKALEFRTGRVSANIFRFLYYTPIHTRFPELKPWYGFVQHGLSLAGLAFPLAFSKGVESVCFSSSHDEVSAHLPWGTHTLLEPKIKVSGISVKSVGAEINWINKLKEIVIFYRENPDLPKPFLRVCLDKMSGRASDNCCKCTKCLRRIIALLLFSEHPHKWGFNIPEPVFSHVRKRCLALDITNTYDMYYWHDMAKMARPYFGKENEEYEKFFSWLEKWIPGDFYS